MVDRVHSLCTPLLVLAHGSCTLPGSWRATPDVATPSICGGSAPTISELWIAFGAGKSFRFLACHEIARVLGPDRCIALPIFHAFTGCDTVSFFQAEVRGLHGTPGMHMQMSPLHSVPWLPGQPHNPYKNG